MNLPEDLKYTAEHEWVRVNGDVARVGITDFAQDSLGDVVYVQLPDAGVDVVAGASISEIESTKSVSDVFAPVTGTIVERNMMLEEHPELVNEQPYEEGWLVMIEPIDRRAVEGLMTADVYRALLQGES
jgi:glycine cleavage system H protein